MVARSADGGRTFGPPARVHDDGWVIDACPHTGPGLAVDAAGRVHVTWYTGAEGWEWVYYAASDEDGEFGPPVPLTRPAETTTSQTGLAADGSGAVWLAWEEWEADGKRIRLAYPCRCAPRAARLT